VPARINGVINPKDGFIQRCYHAVLRMLGFFVLLMAVAVVGGLIGRQVAF
jgi:hypothetical protein